MMYEMTTDEAVDYVLGTEEDVHDTETENAGDGQDETRWDIPGEGTERATCRRCGGLFLKPPKSKRTLCPACFSAQVSAGMKTSHAARKAKREARKAEAAANDRQIKPEDPAQKAWDALGASETAANTPEAPPQERAPEDMTAGELVDAPAAGMRREPGDVVLALYQAARDVARTSGIQTRVLIETMYELDTVISHIGGV